MIALKRLISCLVALSLMCCVFSLTALADDAGALSETELSQWIDQVLRRTMGQQPLNAPVGEESHTEDGYAFIYDFATLYYNKPVLDAESILQAVVVTDESYAAPRGITLGSDETLLLNVFGWQNPFLMGDGSSAAFYRLEQLPESAYWSWAQHDENWQLTQVQCAIHVKAGEDRYTDAGVQFALEGGTVTSIRVYGLYDYITAADVRANLDAVAGVEAAAAGSDWLKEGHTAGYTNASGAAIFAQEDLTFGGLDYLTLTIDPLNAALGESASTETVDEDGEQFLVAAWENAYFSSNEAGTQVLSVNTDAIAGPRGLRVGDSYQDVLNLFHADGEGRVLDGMYAILYGDGVNAPYALIETGDEGTIVSYTFQVQQSDPYMITLRLQFEDALLTEWMLYRW